MNEPERCDTCDAVAVRTENKRLREFLVRTKHKARTKLGLSMADEIDKVLGQHDESHKI